MSKARTLATILALRDGKQFLSANHWTKHKMMRQLPDGKLAFCARGALKYGPFAQMGAPFEMEGEVIDPYLLYFDAVEALDKAASRTTGGRIYVEQYNDMVAPDKDAILSLYSSAIKELEDSLK